MEFLQKWSWLGFTKTTFNIHVPVNLILQNNSSHTIKSPEGSQFRGNYTPDTGTGKTERRPEVASSETRNSLAPPKEKDWYFIFTLMERMRTAGELKPQTEERQ